MKRIKKTIISIAELNELKIKKVLEKFLKRVKK